MTNFKFSAQDNYAWSNGGRKLPKYVLAWQQADGTMEYPWLFDSWFRESDVFSPWESGIKRRLQLATLKAMQYPSIWAGTDRDKGGQWTYVKTRGAPTMEVDGRMVNCHAQEIQQLRRLYPNGRNQATAISSAVANAWKSYSAPNVDEYHKIMENIRQMNKELLKDQPEEKKPDYAGALRLLGAEMDALKNRVKALEEELVLVQSGDA